MFVWAGGVKAPGLVADSGLPTGHNGRVKVDQYLRVLDRPEIYVAGDLASVTDPRTGHVLPPLAQVALEEGETVARNLAAELKGQPLEAFSFPKDVPVHVWDVGAASSGNVAVTEVRPVSLMVRADQPTTVQATILNARTEPLDQRPVSLRLANKDKVLTIPAVVSAAAGASI